MLRSDKSCLPRADTCWMLYNCMVTRLRKFVLRYKVEVSEVIRAFSIDRHFDFNRVLDFDGYADRFIFRCQGDAPGGNGVRFDWDQLKNYEGGTLFY